MDAGSARPVDRRSAPGLRASLPRVGSGDSHLSSGMHLRLLGPVEARLDGRSLPLGPPKQRAVMAMLALRPGHTVSIDELAEGLWGERAAGQRGEDDPALRLAPAPGDRGRRRGDRHPRPRLRARARRRSTSTPSASSALVDEGRAAEALALWHDAPLSDLRDEPFAPAEIRRLEELRARALESAIDADLAAGRHREVLARIDALVAEHPLRERLHGQRMLALYRAGRQADALAAYREARATLVEEIGVEPGPGAAAAARGDPRAGSRARAPGRRAAVGARRRPARRRAPRRLPVVPLLAGALLAAGLVAFGISRVGGGDQPVHIREDAVALLEPENGAIRRQIPVGRGTGIDRARGGIRVGREHSSTRPISRVGRDDDAVVTDPRRRQPGGARLRGRVAVGRGRRRPPRPAGRSGHQPRRAARSRSATSRARWRSPTGRCGSPPGRRARSTASTSAEAASCRKIRLGSDPTALAAAPARSGLRARRPGRSPRSTRARTCRWRRSTSATARARSRSGEGAVWVVNHTDGTVSRIDPGVEGRHRARRRGERPDRRRRRRRARSGSPAARRAR